MEVCILLQMWVRDARTPCCLPSTPGSPGPVKPTGPGAEFSVVRCHWHLGWCWSLPEAPFISLHHAVLHRLPLPLVPYPLSFVPCPLSLIPRPLSLKILAAGVGVPIQNQECENESNPEFIFFTRCQNASFLCLLSP